MLCAILFLYRHVIGRPLRRFDGLVWAKRSAHVPSVLTRDEVMGVLAQMSGVPWLVCALLYGAGLRLAECLELRVKDLDVGGGQIVVRSGKGGKDRRAPLPTTLIDPLEDHLVGVRQLHGRDLAAGYGRVAMPDALAVKYPHAAEEWGWQFVFPAGRICRDPRWGAPSRYHLHESVVQRAVTEAVRRAGLTKRATCHSFRHHADSRIMPTGYQVMSTCERRPTGPVVVSAA